MVEELFYTLGIYFEPRYAAGRNIVVKQICLVGLIDDAYEAYGLYEELQYFTDAIQRFALLISLLSFSSGQDVHMYIYTHVN